MRALLIIFITILIQSCDSQTRTPAQPITDFNDTTYLKTIEWDSLNRYVDYKIIQAGEVTRDTMSQFSIKPIAIYRYSHNSFESTKIDTSLIVGKQELEEYIMSDIFGDVNGIDCFLRINSSVRYLNRADLLETVFIWPIDTSAEGVQSLMNKLGKRPYVQELEYEEKEPNELDKLASNDSTKTIFINITLTQDFRDLDKIGTICAQLNEHPGIKGAFFTDLFVGYNETETILRLTTKKKSS